MDLTTEPEPGGAIGNGGWVRVDDHPGEVLFVRFADIDGRLRPCEVYVRADEGIDDLRRFKAIRLANLVAWAARSEPAAMIRARTRVPGPDLRRLASYFATTFGSQAKNWIADSMRAQYPGAKQMPIAGERRERQTAVDANLRKLVEAMETGGDRQIARAELYRRVGEVCLGLQSHGVRNHAAVIADETGVEVRKAHAWVRRARERGYLPPDPYGRGRPAKEL